MQEEKCIKYIIVVQQHQPDQLRNYVVIEREKFFVSHILFNQKFCLSELKSKNFSLFHDENMWKRGDRVMLTHFQCILNLSAVFETIYRPFLLF